MVKKLSFATLVSLVWSVNPVFGQMDEYHQIPLTIRANIIFVKLLVNNRPANFIVDTGASVSLLDRKQAEKYNFICFDEYGAGEINSLAGINSMLPTGGIRLGYDFFTFRKFRFYGSNFDPLHNYLAKRNIHVLGIVGADFLIKNKAVIDYNNKILTIKK
ncbi:MAG: aspartyl protease family protein [Cytophagales bacterium]|nr:aspartyl protease family protein [Cytophagales bacterium]